MGSRGTCSSLGGRSACRFPTRSWRKLRRCSSAPNYQPQYSLSYRLLLSHISITRKQSIMYTTLSSLLRSRALLSTRRTNRRANTHRYGTLYEGYTARWISFEVLVTLRKAWAAGVIPIMQSLQVLYQGPTAHSAALAMTSTIYAAVVARPSTLDHSRTPPPFKSAPRHTQQHRRRVGGCGPRAAPSVALTPSAAAAPPSAASALAARAALRSRSADACAGGVFFWCKARFLDSLPDLSLFETQTMTHGVSASTVSPPCIGTPEVRIK